MGKFIEFSWEKKYLLMISQAFLMSFRMEVNFFGIKENEKTLESSILFDLITECCLTFSIFIYIIEKYKLKNLKTKKKNLKIDLNLAQIKLDLKIKKYDIYILPKSSLHNIYLILFLISITGLFKFFFSFFNYFLCLKKFKNYNEFLNTYFSTFLIVNTFILSLIKAKISKKKFYLHNIFAIINIFIITIFIVIIYHEIYFDDIEIKNSLFIYSSFFCWLVIFLFFMDLLIYKILTEKYYLSIYSLNAIEGFFITIYTIIFYFLFLKKEKGDPFDFNNYRLVASCILQIIINILIKFIVYTYDEMYETIPYFLQIFFDTIKNIFKEEEKSKLKLNLLLILPNLYLIFFLLVFIEIIIIKVCNMEKKTKKYLQISQISEYEFIDQNQDLIKEFI